MVASQEKLLVNYGVRLEPLPRSVQAEQEFWFHTFVLELPDQAIFNTPTQFFEPPCPTPSNRERTQRAPQIRQLHQVTQRPNPFLPQTSGQDSTAQAAPTGTPNPRSDVDPGLRAALARNSQTQIPNSPQLHPKYSTRHKRLATNDTMVCLTINSTLTALRNLQADLASVLATSLQEITEALPEVNNVFSQTRHTRSLLPLGSFLKGLFGTADDKEVQIALSHIKALEKKTQAFSSVFQEHDQALQSFIRLTSGQMSKLVQSVTENHETLQGLEQQFIQTSTLLKTNVELLNLLSKQQGLTFSMKQHLQDTIAGVYHLKNGKISPHLLPTRIIKEALLQISQILRTRYPSFHLLADHADSYYNWQHFIVGRKGLNIHVTVKFPLSAVDSTMKVYQLKTWALPINTSTPHGTQISGLPDMMAVSQDMTHYAVFSKLQWLYCSKFAQSYFCPAGILDLKPLTHMSCPLALFLQNKDQVKEHCDFSLVPNAIKPEIREISPGQLLITNVTRATMVCQGQIKTISPCEGQIICLLHLPCHCKLSNQDHYIPPRILNCLPHNSSTVTTRHVINLALVQHFFDATQLQHILPDTLFQHPVELSIPKLHLPPDQFKHFIAESHQYHFKLSQLAKEVKAESGQVQSISGSYLLPLPNSFSDTNSIITWITLAMSILATIISAYLFYKVRMLAAALTLLKPNAAQALPTQISLIYGSSTPTQELISTPDIQMPPAMNIIMLILLVILVLLNLFRIRKQLPHTKLTLQLVITEGNRIMYIPILNLSHCSHNWFLKGSTFLPSIKVTGILRPQLTLDWADMSLINVLTQTPVKLPGSLKMNPLLAIKFRRITATNYLAYLVCTQNGIQTYLQLHPVDKDTATCAQQEPTLVNFPSIACDHSSLYPSLP